MSAFAPPYEALYGFSRARREGDNILVAGTAPIEADGSSTPGDAHAQASRCCAIIGEAIASHGGGRVIRTRMFITDPADADAIGSAHAAAFGADRPVATMVVVAALLRPEWRVEIEAEALAAGDDERQVASADTMCRNEAQPAQSSPMSTAGALCVSRPTET